LDLNQQVKDMMESNNTEAIDSLIQEYTPFIISTASEHLGRYLSVENDGAFGVSLSAFHEAMERYEIEKGNFLSFAKLVIKSRLSNFEQKLLRTKQTVEWDEQLHSFDRGADNELKMEIEAFENVLKQFGLDYEELTDGAPKHRDTRERANRIAYDTSGVPEFVSHIYHKRRLPIARMAERFFISLKVIKRCKIYILASVIIWTEKFTRLQEWIRPKKSLKLESDL